jgi:hypothetical protein
MFVNVKQNTDEWFDLRLGKATSSNFAKIMANYGKAFGDPAVKYAQKIALERVTGERDETESFSNKFMDRGNELEPVAIEKYEEKTFFEVTNGGFFYNEAETIGDSPDGNVGDEGSIEVKCVIPNTHWQRLKSGGIDSAYKWQIHGHIWLGEREWCDFVSYCPEMPEGKQLYIERVYKDEAIIQQMALRLAEFESAVQENIEILKS